MSEDGQVDIEPVKTFARRRLSGCKFLRELILQEPDLLDRREFVTKVLTWLRLLEKEVVDTDSTGARMFQNRFVTRQ